MFKHISFYCDDELVYKSKNRFIYDYQAGSSLHFRWIKDINRQPPNQLFRLN